jgi:glycosyltransferase involved in cell wall biosynthesis
MSLKTPIYIAVINDIATDQRVQRVASTLSRSKNPITIIGRKLKDSPPVNNPCFKIKRFQFLVNKGFTFYAFYNIRLFLYLIFKKSGLILSNDMDTLPACFLASRLKKSKIVFDAHELFAEVPELQEKILVKRFWKGAEKILLPKLKYAYTVSSGLASEFYKDYGIKMEVVRNLPFRKQIDGIPPLDPPAIIYQGALNKGRGIEKVIKALLYLENIQFIIIGTGDIEDKLHELVKKTKVGDKVIFMGRKLPNEVKEITPTASLGISLEENLALNYYYALPNKVFDYIQAGVPVLCSGFPEMKKIVDDYGIGQATLEEDPEKLAVIIDKMIKNREFRNEWKKNLKIASNELCWEKEEIKLMKVYEKVGLVFDDPQSSF